MIVGIGVGSRGVVDYDRAVVVPYTLLVDGVRECDATHRHANVGARAGDIYLSRAREWTLRDV